MLRLFAISGFLLIVGWTTPSSAKIVGNLFECKPIAMQELGMDGKLGPFEIGKLMLKSFKRLIFDETTGILGFGKAHPPIKFTVHQIGKSKISSRSLGHRNYGNKPADEDFISAFYINHFTKGKSITEKFPFYILNIATIYTGHCEKI